RHTSRTCSTGKIEMTCDLTILRTDPFSTPFLFVDHFLETAGGGVEILGTGIGTRDGFYGVLRIQSPRGLDDSRCWMVRRARPFGVIHRRVLNGLDGEIHNATKSTWVCGYGTVDTIVVTMQCGLGRSGRASGNQDRHDLERVTGLMEVFK